VISSEIQLIDESEIHFLTRQPDQGRSIPHLPFYDGERLYVYAPHASGKLMVLHPLDSEHTHYVAKSPFGEHDFRDEFWRAVIQRFTVSPIIRVANAMRSDVMNALASLQQYFVNLHYGNTVGGLSDTALVATQLEYTFANHRAFYDLMNQIVINFRSAKHKKSRQMAKSFRKTIEISNDELQAKFGVQQCFIECIRRHETMFRAIRDARDAVLHGGQSPAHVILRFDDGYAVGEESALVKRLAHLQFWLVASLRNGTLPLLPLFALIAADILSLATEIGACMATVDDAPAEIAVGHDVFFRSSLNIHASNLEKYLTQQWLAPTDVLTFVPRAQAG